MIQGLKFPRINFVEVLDNKAQVENEFVQKLLEVLNSYNYHE